MTPSLSADCRRAHLLALALLLALPAPAARAATSLAPLCQLRDGSVLFFAESSHACPNALASCREMAWAYATFAHQGAGTWSFQHTGAARLDENAPSESNALSGRQRFEAPAAQPCVAFFRAARLPSPDLPDAEGWFRYSFEKGQLMIHWKTLKRALPLQARWDVADCQKNCGPGGPGPRATRADKGRMADAPEADPVFDLRLDGVALLGFPQQGVKSERSTGWIALVPLDSLKKAQADLLYRDALSFSQSARDDLLGSAMVAGLLDAALQLDPGNERIRLDYARHFAGQAVASKAVRELKRLPATGELKARLAADPAFEPIRAATAFQQFLAALP